MIQQITAWFNPPGPPGGVPLSKARILASEARAKLREGIDLITERQAARAAQARASTDAAERTFRAAALALVESKRSGWRSARHAAQWLATLEAHAFPIIGEMPVAAIATADILRVLRPIWDQIPETASRLRQRMEAVLDAARVKGWRDGGNPARWKGHLAGDLPLRWIGFRGHRFGFYKWIVSPLPFSLSGAV